MEEIEKVTSEVYEAPPEPVPSEPVVTKTKSKKKSKNPPKQRSSNVEFLNTFYKLRKEVIMLLMRDFGIKSKIYTVEMVGDMYKMTYEDACSLANIIETYGLNLDVTRYPLWVIDSWRDQVSSILDNIANCITLANSIYVSNPSEYYLRRNHWDNAIGWLYRLQDKFHEILELVRGIRLGSYKIIAELIEKEIKVIKAVRKSDNRWLKEFQTTVADKFNGSCDRCTVYTYLPNYLYKDSMAGMVSQYPVGTAGIQQKPKIQDDCCAANGIKPMKIMCTIVDKKTKQAG